MGETVRTLQVRKEGLRDLHTALSFVAKTIADENLVAPEITISGLEASTGRVEWFDVMIEGRVRNGTETDPSEHREGG